MAKLDPSVLEDVVEADIVDYPLLFLYATPEASRMAVYNHLFLSGGNGHGWTVDEPSWLASVHKAKKTYFSMSPLGWRVIEPGKTLERGNKESRSDFYSDGVREQVAKLAIYPYVGLIRPAGEVGWYPDVIKEDWKIALIKTLKWAKDVYSEPGYLDYYMERSLQEDDYKAITKRREQVIKSYGDALNKLTLS